MAQPIFTLFSLWFLLLPFTIISSLYLGIVALDKLIAPILLIVWLVMFSLGHYRISQNKLLIIIIAFLFFFLRNISFIDNSAVYISLLKEDAILFGYFCLPILYVNNIDKVKAIGKLVSINAAVGCTSAFLVALGLLSLPYERFSRSRIGLDIDKSIGLFTSYGDLAQHAAFLLILSVFLPVVFVKKRKLRYLISFVAVVIVIMGLIGNQSRSFLLSIIAAFLAASFFLYRSGLKRNMLTIDILLSAVGIVLVGVATYFFVDIINLLAGLGGEQAQSTAGGRVLQYRMAFDLVKENLILGVNGDVFSRAGASIHGVHNMWLGQLARGGVISVAILLALLFLIFRSSLILLNNQSAKYYAIVTIGYMAAVIMSTLFYPGDSVLFWVLLGVNAAIITTLKSNCVG